MTSSRLFDASLAGTPFSLATTETLEPLSLVSLRPPVEARFERGERLNGRYRVEDVLGAGGMGVVYLVMDEAESQVVALKTIQSEAVDPARLGRSGPSSAR